MTIQTVPHNPGIAELPLLERLRVSFQKHRIQMTNRVAASEAERSNMPVVMANFYADRFQSLEDEVTFQIATIVKDHEMWPWLSGVKGIGPGLAGSLVAYVDIERAIHVSSLWKYAGMAVTDGAADRPVKGKKLPYNANLKRVCYLIGASFMRSRSPYRAVYDQYKVKYQTEHADWTPKHIDFASRRPMIKLFLEHFWREWRTVRGLPVTDPWIVTHGGHVGGYIPETLYRKDRQVEFA